MELDQESTGHPRVDAVLQSVALLGDQPPGDQVAAYERAAATLRDALNDVNEPEPATG